MKAAGYPWHAAGENVAGSSRASLDQLEDMLMIDKDLSWRPHRVNLLGSRAGFTFREIGIGGFSGNSPNPSGLKDLLTQDFGMADSGPFLVGVAYQDKNSNNSYDIGEGLGGVSVQPDRGDYCAFTSSSGGYALPAPAAAGMVKLTASGGALPAPLARTVTLSDANIKVDFVIPTRSR